MTNERYPIFVAALLLRVELGVHRVQAYSFRPIARDDREDAAIGSVSTRGSGPGPIAVVEVAVGSRHLAALDAVLVDGRPTAYTAGDLMYAAVKGERGLTLHHPAMAPEPEGAAR